VAKLERDGRLSRGWVAKKRDRRLSLRVVWLSLGWVATLERDWWLSLQGQGQGF
jgi:hypothetical protein